MTFADFTKYMNYLSYVVPQVVEYLQKTHLFQFLSHIIIIIFLFKLLFWQLI